MIFIAGANGFIGSSIMGSLKGRIRAYSKSFISKKEGRIEYTNKLDIKGCSTVINCVGVIKEREKGDFKKAHVDFLKDLVEESKKLKVRHFIQISALGSDALKTDYQRTKFQAESIVKGSGLAYTILRPSLVFGRKDSFTNMISSKLKFKFFPIFGDGNYKMQPISINDLCFSVNLCIKEKKARNKTFEIGGEVLTYREMLKRIALFSGRKVFFIKIPIKIAKILVSIIELSKDPIITKDQLEMLTQGNIVKNNDFFKFFNKVPGKFNPHYLKKSL